jgi:hypothetical protein
LTFIEKMLLGTVGVSCLFVLKTTPASAVSIDFSVDDSGDNWGAGTFEGTDSDTDNLLTINELTNFNMLFSLEGLLTLGDLFGFGSFNLNTGVWNNDAPGLGEPTGSWFSWNNGGIAVNPEWDTVATDYTPTPPTPTSVPESSSVLGLLAVGALGASSALKRKSQEKIKA